MKVHDMIRMLDDYGSTLSSILKQAQLKDEG